MITERAGDLLEQIDLTHIAHQANLYHTFGAGLAAAIDRKFPYAAAADRETVHGDAGKLGTYSLGFGQGPTIVNLYTQRGFGAGSTDYPAMVLALANLEKRLRLIRPMNMRLKLGLPFKLGCGLAGGNWLRVRVIIEEIFAESPIPVVICTRPEDLI